MPEHLVWPVWRLWLKKGTSVGEIEKNWHVGMVLDANEVLDLEEEAERRANEEMRRGDR